MCFSATASFTTMALTGVIGIATLSRATHAREIPTAAIPLVFAVQQAVEGLLWLHLPQAGSESATSTLTLAFLLFAEVFWPIYAPLAVYLLEPRGQRRKLMACCVAIGLAIGSYFLWRILHEPHSAMILGGHIVYVTGQQPSFIFGGAYLIATGLPLILSSRPAVSLMGWIVLTGCAVAYVVYWEAFTSIWCFFGAAASLVLLFHFALSQRRQAAGLLRI